MSYGYAPAPGGGQRRKPQPAATPSSLNAIIGSPPSPPPAGTGLRQIAGRAASSRPEAIYRQTYQPQARDVYRRLYNRVTAQGLLPGGDRPSLRFRGTNDEASAFVSPLNPNAIVADPGVIDLLASPAPGPRNRGKELLLHELAHTQQPYIRSEGATGYNKPVIEGGAEAFSHYAANQIGFNAPPPSYPEEMRYVRRKYGPQFVREGQFR